jgi:hypothetical protein
MGFDPWKWFTIALQLFQAVSAVMNEPVGGPPIAVPPIYVTEGGFTYEVDASVKKIK